MGSCQSSHRYGAVAAASAPSPPVSTSQKKESFASTAADSNSAAVTNASPSGVSSTSTRQQQHQQPETEQHIQSNNNKNNNNKGHSRHSSIGLDEMVASRKAQGHLVTNIVHIESLSGRKIEEVYDGVHDGDKLGEGVAGFVRLCVHKATGTQFAVKCLDLSLAKSSPESQQEMREEINIMAQLDHPNIARLQEVYEDENQIYLVQELGSGGELFDVLDEQPDYRYGETEAVQLMLQILSALRYLHSKGIVHRDLKLENFLFSTNRHKQLKMIGKCVLVRVYVRVCA